MLEPLRLILIFGLSLIVVVRIYIAGGVPAFNVSFNINELRLFRYYFVVIYLISNSFYLSSVTVDPAKCYVTLIGVTVLLCRQCFKKALSCGDRVLLRW